MTLSANLLFLLLLRQVRNLFALPDRHQLVECFVYLQRLSCFCPPDRRRHPPTTLDIYGHLIERQSFHEEAEELADGLF